MSRRSCKRNTITMRPFNFNTTSASHINWAMKCSKINIKRWPYLLGVIIILIFFFFVILFNTSTTGGLRLPSEVHTKYGNHCCSCCCCCCAVLLFCTHTHTNSTLFSCYLSSYFVSLISNTNISNWIPEKFDSTWLLATKYQKKKKKTRGNKNIRTINVHWHRPELCFSKWNIWIG